ncbi:MAG: CaiB/BaiF CoA-transferase family protein [Marmoricola sp.]
MGLWVAGPAAGGILADWGAEVIKVEALTGDPMRRLFGAMSGSKEEQCPPFDLYNRGKRSVAIDVNTDQGRDLAERRITKADVFITNMRPDFLQRVRLDHDRLLELQPRLVYASLTGYGLNGPDRNSPGYDVAAFSARSGLADRSSPAGAPPPTLAGGLGDSVTGITLVAGVLAALVQREHTGQGQLVSTSLLRAGTYCIGMDLSTRLGLGRLRPPDGRKAPPNPLLNSYVAGDGKWMWLMGAESERHWPALMNAMDQPELRTDPRFDSPRQRRRNSAELVALLDKSFATRSRNEWARLFAEHEVWWAPVNSVDDLLVDPQVEAAGVFIGPQSPPAGAPAEERSAHLATPVDFGLAPQSMAAGPPAVGADTVQVLRDLGLGDEEIHALQLDGVLPSRE